MQDRYDVRFEWGAAGAAALAPLSSCLVVVDVLSFSTSVTVAVAIAVESGSCPLVPVLAGGAFTAVGGADSTG
jgi:hypothetical protein